MYYSSAVPPHSEEEEAAETESMAEEAETESMAKEAAKMGWCWRQEGADLLLPAENLREEQAEKWGCHC